MEGEAVTLDARLCRAAEAGDITAVRALLDEGASANAAVALPDAVGSIPVLFFPSAAGHVEMVRLLLERGAAPTDGESVYHAAQHDHRDVLALLHQYGADLSRGPAGTGNSPLHFLASHHVSNAISARAIRGMEWLLVHGADPNVPLTAIADGQWPTQLGETPLHRAVACGHGATVVELLLAHGATVDARRTDGATPYALAVRSGNDDAAQALLAAGADRTRVAPLDRLLGACFRESADEARLLLVEHPDLMSSLDSEAKAALLTALNAQRMGVFSLMLSLGWPLDVESEWGGTALHWAAWNGWEPVVQELIAHGAPVNQRDSRYGSSPLAWAAHGSVHCERGNDTDYPAIVHRLIDAGATRAESFNRWHESPESMARPSVVNALRERGFLNGH